MANPHNPVTIVTGGGNLVTAVTDGGNPVTAVTDGGNPVTLTDSGHNPVTFIGGIGDVTDFVFTVQTTGTPETFTIPCTDIGTFNATIDWGDLGPTSSITTFDDADLEHSYAAPGTYTVTVSGTFPSIRFNNGGDAAKVRSVTNLGEVGWLSLSAGFYGCTGMTSFVFGNTDLSSLITLANAWRNCSSVTQFDMSSQDISSVTNMSNTFFGMTAVVTLTLNGIDTSKVTTFNNMLRSLPNVIGLDLSGLDVTSLTTASSMMLGTDMSTANYDATLIAWEAQTLQTGVTVDFGGSIYTSGGAAEAARDSLTNLGTNAWEVTDGGGT